MTSSSPTIGPFSARLALCGLLLVCGTASANLWQCDAKAVYQLTDSSEIKEVRSPDVTFTAEVGDIFYFDESSGIVRQVSRVKPFNREHKFELWQPGSDRNSAVGVYLRKGVQANPVMIIRVTAFQKEVKLLFMDDHGEIVTGRCRSLTR